MHKPNSRYSKTYLTTKNYRGPNLHQSLHRRITPAQAGTAAKEKSDVEYDKMASTLTQEEMDIMAPPESSSDEDTAPPERKTIAKPVAKTSKTTTSAVKRNAIEGTAATTRPKRRKLMDIPSLETIIPADESASNDLFDTMILSGSQKKRSQGYASRKCSKAETIKKEAPRPVKENAFVSFEEPSPKKRTPVKRAFKKLEDVPELENRALKAHTAANINILPSPPRRSIRIKSDIQIPPDADIPSSVDTEQQSVFDSLSSPETRSHKRTSSNSSLSSVDDMVLLEGKLEGREESLTIEDESSKSCPICLKPIKMFASLRVPLDLDSLPYQQQQKFCSLHQVADANVQWQARGYPKVSWEQFECFRIQEKLAELRKVINRHASSFYRDQLDAKIKEAKGNRKKIRSYLNEDIVDVVKPGYLGPKGARIMGQVLTKSLNQALKDASSKDPTIRTVGIGTYVSAVLVPELTLQLVMEDMKLKKEEDGRKMLNDSTEIGVLLYPDDDKVETRDEDDV
jgi:hypothetical protein